MASQCKKCGDKNNYDFALNIGLCSGCIGQELEQLQSENERLREFITKLKEKSQFAHIPNYVLVRECEQALKEQDAAD